MPRVFAICSAVISSLPSGPCWAPRIAHFVAHAHVTDLGDVEHGHVHADRADHRRALAAHEQRTAVGQRATEAIGVADRDGRDAARASRHERFAVADGRSPRADHAGRRFPCARASPAGARGTDPRWAARQTGRCPGARRPNTRAGSSRWPRCSRRGASSPRCPLGAAWRWLARTARAGGRDRFRIPKNRRRQNASSSLASEPRGSGAGPWPCRPCLWGAMPKRPMPVSTLQVNVQWLGACELHFVGQGFELGGVMHDGRQVMA